jgi:hypothetical protein
MPYPDSYKTICSKIIGLNEINQHPNQSQEFNYQNRFQF